MRQQLPPGIASGGYNWVRNTMISIFMVDYNWTRTVIRTISISIVITTVYVAIQAAQHATIHTII